MLLAEKCCRGLMAACYGGGVGAWLNYGCCAGIAAVRIMGDCPNSAVVVVDPADPQVGYTPCGTWEKHR
jgi:hypothetical protein